MGTEDGGLSKQGRHQCDRFRQRTSQSRSTNINFISVCVFRPGEIEQHEHRGYGTITRERHQQRAVHILRYLYAESRHRQARIHSQWYLDLDFLLHPRVRDRNQRGCDTRPHHESSPQAGVSQRNATLGAPDVRHRSGSWVLVR